MAETVTKKIETDFLTCQVCLMVFREPCILKCLHTFCKQCILGLKQTAKPETSITCPVCREKCPAGDGDLRANFYINGLLDTMQLKPGITENCTICAVAKKKKAATSKCLHCGDVVCQDCAKKHTFSSSTVSHKIVNLQDLHAGKHDKELREMQTIPCQAHGTEFVKYFCNNCRMLVCRDCILLDHYGHECLPPEEALKLRQPKLDAYVEELQSNLKGIAQTEEHVELTVGVVSNLENRLKRNINALTITLIQKIQHAASLARTNVGGKVQEWFRVLEAYKREARSTRKAIQSTLDVCHKVFEGGNEIEVLSLEDLLHKRLQQMQQHNLGIARDDLVNKVSTMRLPSLTPCKAFYKEGDLDLFYVGYSKRRKRGQDKSNKTEMIENNEENREVLNGQLNDADELNQEEGQVEQNNSHSKGQKQMSEVESVGSGEEFSALTNNEEAGEGGLSNDEAESQGDTVEKLTGITTESNDSHYDEQPFEDHDKVNETQVGSITEEGTDGQIIDVSTESHNKSTSFTSLLESKASDTSIEDKIQEYSQCKEAFMNLLEVTVGDNNKPEEDTGQNTNTPKKEENNHSGERTSTGSVNDENTRQVKAANSSTYLLRAYCQQNPDQENM